MTQISPGNGACCLPSVDGVTYLKVGSRGVTVGMTGLDKLFQQLWSLTARPLWMMGHRPEQATDDELVGMARQFNYIARKESVERDYAEALRRAYEAFCARQETQLWLPKAQPL